MDVIELPHFEPQACSLCNSNLAISEYPWIGSNGYRVAVCTRCGLGHTTPRPSAEAIRLLYERDSGDNPLGVRDFYSDAGWITRVKAAIFRREIRTRFADFAGGGGGSP